VFGQADLSAEAVEVDSGGRMTLPLVGDLLVINRTLKDVEGLIEEALSPEYLKNPVVSVEIINYRPCYIIGEVANPGPYPCAEGMRVIDVIAMASGFTYRAAERAAEDECVAIINQECAGPETLVMPGDIIEVPERFF